MSHETTPHGSSPPPKRPRWRPDPAFIERVRAIIERDRELLDRLAD